MANEGEQSFEVLPSMRLLRRLVLRHFVPDGKGGFRLSSAAFKTKEMSVDCEEIHERDGNSWQVSLADYPSEGLARFPASLVLSKGHQVTHSPEQADPSRGLRANPAHCIVTGRLGDGTANDILKARTILAYPAGMSSSATS